MVAFVALGIFLQADVLVYAAFSQYRLKLLINDVPVENYGFPVLLAGTLSLAVGIFLCAHAIEMSTKETTWESTGIGGSKSVIWL